MDYRKEYEKWLASPALTAEEHAELEAIKNDDKEIRDYPVEEILIRLHYQYPRAAIIEIPIRFSKRAAGESKRDLFRFILSYLSTMKKLLKIKRSIRRSRR